jgi:hypothetical protein
MKNLSMPAWMAPPFIDTKKADCITVDNTSPAAKQVSGFSVQFGVSDSGELNGDTAHPYHPSGIYAPPVQSTMGQPGTECVYIVRNDEGFYLGCRDTVNQSKAGTVNPGEIAIYAPGAQGSNKFYLDINGNAFLSVQNDIQITAQQNIEVTAQQDITLTSKANNLTVVSSTINLGSSSPSLSAAISQNTDENFTAIATASMMAAIGIQAALSADPGTTPPEPLAAAVAALLVAYFQMITPATLPTTASMVVKLSG